MSIINEALKKVEPKQDTEKNASNYKKRGKRAVFIFLSLGLILILTTFALLKRQPLLLPERAKPVSLSSSSLGLSKADTFPSLTLKGIAHFGEENWAIIDDQITRQGQFIKGAKIEEIFFDRVDLTFKGKRFSLKIAP